MAGLSVNGLPLPAELVEAMEDGRWGPSVDVAAMKHVFGDPPADPKLYRPADMERENRAWAQQTDPLYLGHPSDDAPPGDLDPQQSVLIGDLGPDMPFALDYRSTGPPTVVYLDLEGRWRRVASSAGELLSALGLGADR